MHPRISTGDRIECFELTEGPCEDAEGLGRLCVCADEKTLDNIGSFLYSYLTRF